MEIKIWYEERKCGDFAYLIERREKVGGMNEEEVMMMNGARIEIVDFWAL